MKEMIEAVRKFTAGEIAPHAAGVDRSGQLPQGLFRTLGEQGVAGLAVPQKWGGIGVDLASFAACLEVIAAGCASTAWVLLSHSASARTLVGAGTDAQKDHYLPQLASGQMVGSAMAGTEAGGGSNPMGMRTRASHDRGGWVLEGGKEFISLAGAADLYVVMARTGEPPPALGCFLVEKADTGLAFGRREELLGVRGVPVGGLALAQCRLGGERLLGAETGGLAVMGAMGSWGLAGAAAAAAGVAAAALDETSAYLRERVVAGAALASLPGVQSAMGELRSELAGARAPCPGDSRCRRRTGPAAAAVHGQGVGHGKRRTYRRPLHGAARCGRLFARVRHRTPCTRRARFHHSLGQQRGVARHHCKGVVVLTGEVDAARVVQVATAAGPEDCFHGVIATQ